MSQNESEKVEKKRSSWGVRTKKFFASKTAQSKVGRSAISHFLGEEGNRLLSSVKNAIAKDKGKPYAKEVKMIIIKMALKGKVLQDESLIRKGDVWKISEPLNTAALNFYACVRPKPRAEQMDDDEKDGKEYVAPGKRYIDVTSLVNDAAVVKKMCGALFAGLISDSGLEKMMGVFDYLCGKEFLEKFMNDPLLADEKMIVFDNLRKILAPLLEQRNFNDDMQEICMIEDCEEFATVPYLDFAASSRCLEHHSEAYEAFISQPSVSHFLEGDGKDYYPFQAQCKKAIERWIRKFYITIVKYRQFPRANFRPIFADEIWKKYLRPGAPHSVNLPKEIVKSIQGDLKSGGQNLFLEAENFCYSKLDTFFKENFCKSPEYLEYVEKVYRLPAYAQTALEEIKKVNKKKGK